MLTMASIAVADRTAAREAVKRYARIEQTSEDGLIEDLAVTALLLCEAFCGRIALLRAGDVVLPASGSWTPLRANPVVAITAVEGLPAEGAAFALPAESYAIDIDADGTGWVRVTQPGAAGRVRVRFQAGQAPAWDGLAEPLRQGVVRLATHLFSHRDDPAEAAPPAAVAALWRPWQRLRVGGCSRG